MKINTIKKGILSYVIIDNFFDDFEAIAIRQECLDLQNELKSPKEVFSATDNGIPLKTSKGLFLHNFFKAELHSAILTFYRKLFCDDIYKEIEKEDVNFRHLRYSTKDTTLLNIYKNNEEYNAHTDNSVLTAITMFKIGEFTGGELVFPDFDEVVEFKENRLVLFPGCLLHKANPIKSENDGMRITIVKFISYKED